MQSGWENETSDLAGVFIQARAGCLGKRVAGASDGSSTNLERVELTIASGAGGGAASVFRLIFFIFLAPQLLALDNGDSSSLRC